MGLQEVGIGPSSPSGMGRTDTRAAWVAADRVQGMLNSHCHQRPAAAEKAQGAKAAKRGRLSG